ncbi:MAG: RNA helicase [Spirochaetes bacterium GWF1_41_5]|nr:MAG: RNA helicase [Spirochaetes bacterium GWF1_41_5]HBE03974.1 RNA helicase [Spirochaetia bacterium]
MPETQNQFAQLGLNEQSIAALTVKGFEEPTPIQSAVIPLLLADKRDIIGQAQTGTGKTAAFALPVLEKINLTQKKTQAVILAPTRELAVQVAEEIISLKGKREVTVLPVYGGAYIGDQIRRLEKGVQIITATPGRLLDHIRRGTLSLKNVRFFILDEADEMLNMGFIEEVESIMSELPAEKRIALFSATMPQRIRDLTKKYLNNPESVSVKSEMMTTGLTEQIWYEVHERDKFEALCRIIDMEDGIYALLFCRTKNDTDQITQKLQDRGYEAEGMHGDISQHQREIILDRFRRKKINILAATDVAARGLDINDLTHVINYSLPQGPESYVHRIGRTGRAGKKGIAITFVSPSEYRKLAFIKHITKTEIQKKNIPEIKDIIALKRSRIISEISEAAAAGSKDYFATMAEELLEKNTPAELVRALLSLHYSDELDTSSYASIKPSGHQKRDEISGGATRLFIALGKNTGYSPQKIVKLLSETIAIQSAEIDDIRIFPDYTLVSVPFKKAEEIINAFTSGKKKGPFVKKARENSKETHKAFFPKKEYNKKAYQRRKQQ